MQPTSDLEFYAKAHANGKLCCAGCGELQPGSYTHVDIAAIAKEFEVRGIDVNIVAQEVQRLQSLPHAVLCDGCHRNGYRIGNAKKLHDYARRFSNISLEIRDIRLHRLGCAMVRYFRDTDANIDRILLSNQLRNRIWAAWNMAHMEDDPE